MGDGAVCGFLGGGDRIPDVGLRPFLNIDRV
jgi:hypothetical protein